MMFLRRLLFFQKEINKKLRVVLRKKISSQKFGGKLYALSRLFLSCCALEGGREGIRSFPVYFSSSDSAKNTSFLSFGGLAWFPFCAFF